MTTLVDAGARAPGERLDARPARSPLYRFAGLCLDLYRRGGRALWIATPLAALVVVPEFLQHIVEIKIGMFASTEAFRAHALDPLRMGFGVAKVAGLVLAMLAIARFWWTGSIGAALRMPPRALLRTAFAVALVFALELPFDLLRRVVPAGPGMALAVAAFLIQAFAFVYLVAALLDDRTMTLRRTPAQWRAALLMMVLLVLAYGPCFALHMATHKLALGLPELAVWAIMTFDALVVGLLAALAGTALALGYAAGTGQRLAR
ncbi:hypothetical protein [Sphingomonas kyeonggiensis]|uniref:Uncharacterized membrane protein YhaH (DUF805 family) n=1 Tax=Sphingomonas kyeonggiensis TaxID=1268553 RepID=A0A7W6JSW2_9SPHN|nr:hypothetical protein [Sphingomonas kyeonggiensis]MBB4098984.1 uncharacterized membrane protein YhaH (DUF805 family) [Sphingomonas kyeonggiensis]